MNKPNFFIVGAPKCGTTALAAYLSAHPNVFFCDPKEPNFFSRDLHPDEQRPPSLGDYLQLFSGAGENHLAVAEGSVWSLYSSVAIKDIHAFNQDAKIIVMLRNPVDLVYSLHAYNTVRFSEKEPDLEKLWRLQTSWDNGENLSHPDFPPIFSQQYTKVSRLGDQVEKLLAVFPREQVFFVLFDDLKKNARGVYEDVTAFLGLPQDGKDDFPVINKTPTFKVQWAASLVFWSKRPAFLKAAERVKKILGIQRLGILDRLRSLNSKFNTSDQSRPPLSPGFRARLSDEFQEDVKKLSGLIGRNLSHWR